MQLLAGSWLHVRLGARPILIRLPQPCGLGRCFVFQKHRGVYCFCRYDQEHDRSFFTFRDPVDFVPPFKAAVIKLKGKNEQRVRAWFV